MVVVGMLWVGVGRRVDGHNRRLGGHSRWQSWVVIRVVGWMVVGSGNWCGVDGW